MFTGGCGGGTWCGCITCGGNTKCGCGAGLTWMHLCLQVGVVEVPGVVVLLIVGVVVLLVVCGCISI